MVLLNQRPSAAVLEIASDLIALGADVTLHPSLDGGMLLVDFQGQTAGVQWNAIDCPQLTADTRRELFKVLQKA